MQKINPNNVKVLRMYGGFLTEVMNDDSGKDFEERAKTIESSNHNKAEGPEDEVLQGIIQQTNDKSLAMVQISADGEIIGKISKATLGVSRLFGYNEDELIGRKVNLLMPPPYSKHHDTFLANYLQNGSSGVIGREKKFFGIHKSGYIFPLWITVRALPSSSAGNQFLGTLKPDRSNMTSCWLILNNKLQVEALSAGCIGALNLSKSVIKKKIKFAQLAPEILDQNKVNQYKDIRGGTLTYIMPSFKTNEDQHKAKFYKRATIKESEQVFNPTDEKKLFLCHILDIIFLNEVQGLIVKLDYIQEKGDLTGIEVDERVLNKNFQWDIDTEKYNIYSKKIENENNTESVSSSVSGSQQSSQSNEKSESSSNSKWSEEEQSQTSSVSNSSDLASEDNANQNGNQNNDSSFTSSQNEKSNTSNNQQQQKWQKIDYGAEIPTKRIVNGVFQTIKENQNQELIKKRQNNLQAQEKEKQEQEAKNQSKQKLLSYNRFKKTIREAINDNTEPRSIKNLRYTALIIFTILIAIAATEFFVTQKQFDDIIDRIDYISYSYERLVYVQQIGTHTRSLVLINEGILGSGNETTVRNALKDAVLSLDEIQNELVGKEPNENDILIKFREGKEIHDEAFNIWNAITHLVNQGFTIYNNKIEQITMEDQSVFFVLYNVYNEFYISLEKIAEEQIDDTIDKAIKNDSTMIIILVISIIALLISVSILIPVIKKVNNTRQEVLTLFLDIPKKTVKVLQVKCEKYLSSIQQDAENMSVDSGDVSFISEEEDEEENQEEQLSNQETPFHKSRSAGKNHNVASKNSTMFYVKLFSGIMLVQGYFVAAFLIERTTLNNFKDLSDEFKYTSESEPFYLFSLNTERELVSWGQYLIRLQDPLTVAIQNLEMVYELNNKMLESHLENRGLHKNSYKDTFENLLRKDSCQYLNFADQNIKTVTIEECTQFAEGVVTRGMYTAIVRYFENLRNLLSQFQVSNNRNLVGDKQFKTLVEMELIYIHLTYKELINKMKEELDDQFENMIILKRGLYVGFNIFMALMYFGMWRPFIQKLSKEIWRTKSMLNMIPINIITRIKSVREFLANTNSVIGNLKFN